MRTIKVIDFSIATMIDHDSDRSVDVLERMTEYFALVNKTIISIETQKTTVRVWYWQNE